MASLRVFPRSSRQGPRTRVGGALVYSRAAAAPGLTAPGRTSERPVCARASSPRPVLKLRLPAFPSASAADVSGPRQDSSGG